MKINYVLYTEYKTKNNVSVRLWSLLAKKTKWQRESTESGEKIASQRYKGLVRLYTSKASSVPRSSIAVGYIQRMKSAYCYKSIIVLISGWRSGWRVIFKPKSFDWKTPHLENEPGVNATPTSRRCTVILVQSQNHLSDYFILMTSGSVQSLNLGLLVRSIRNFYSLRRQV